MFGGESSEHDVSIMSARNVYAAMDGDKYDVRLCYIDKVGKWWLLEEWPEEIAQHGGVQLSVVPGLQSLLTLPGYMPLHIDVLFPVLHGENGHEDGTIQGMANLAHIPVIGSGIGASAVCWDKVITKQILAAHGIRVVPYKVHYLGESSPEYEVLVSELHSTDIFVKPTGTGSSVGVSKVHNAGELATALEEAHQHSDSVLIEQAIIGRELEVAVLGNPPNHQESNVGEIIAGEEFYSYDDKYSPGSKAQVLSNADIDDKLRSEIRAIAHDAYELLGCKGLARVDFLVSDGGDVYVNELNTLPGFTNISQYPKLWAEQGIRYTELINRLITLAIKA